MEKTKKKRKRNKNPFESMSDDKKQKFIDYINKSGVSIKQAAIDLKTTTTTINKIYSERFGKKDRELEEIKNQIKNQIKKI
jgi:hypothetical protein